jgi:hypothetical protein
MKRDSIVAGAVSLAWGLVVAAAGYAIVRALQFFSYPDPNPSAVVWSAHAGYFWRAWTVSYGGGIAAFVVLITARRSIEPSARALVPAVGIAAALVALQAAFLP